MRSILLDKNLKLIKSYDGLDWKPSEAKKDIENLLKIYSDSIDFKISSFIICFLIII